DPKREDSMTSQPDTEPGAVLDPLEEASQLHDRTVALREQGQYADAASCARQALALFELEVGTDHPDVANVLGNRAGMHEDQGDYAEAERLYQRAVAIMEHVMKECDTEGLGLEILHIQALRNLAGIYRVQGRYTEAEPLFQRVLTLAEATLGPEHREYATC